MFRSTTGDFIFSPLSDLLAESVDAIRVAEAGMMGYQMADWVMPTVFLRMTGAQEQKLMCIYWDLGSLDLDQRYQHYSGKMGGMSCYDDKKKLCGELLSYIIRNNQSYNPVTDIDRQKLLDDTKSCIEAICGNSVMKDWYASDYKDFEEVTARFKAEELVKWNIDKRKCSDLFSGELYSAFDTLYNHRNRCAHNSSSYQMNLPKFDVMSGTYAVFENYFIRFYILILLDMLFVLLYRTVVSLAELD